MRGGPCERLCPGDTSLTAFCWCKVLEFHDEYDYGATLPYRYDHLATTTYMPHRHSSTLVKSCGHP